MGDRAYCFTININITPYVHIILLMRNGCYGYCFSNANACKSEYSFILYCNINNTKYLVFVFLQDLITPHLIITRLYYYYTSDN